AHLRCRRASPRCGRSPLAITIDSAAEIDKTPALLHSRSCLIARRSPPVTASRDHPAAIASMNQTAPRCQPRGALPLIDRARAPEPSMPSGVRKSFRRSRSEEHTSELQSLAYLVCRLLLE